MGGLWWILVDALSRLDSRVSEWILNGSCGSCWILIGYVGLLLIPVGSGGFPWIPVSRMIMMDAVGFGWILVDYDEYAGVGCWIMVGSGGLWLILVDFDGF